jgi:hypothetical protein
MKCKCGNEVSALYPDGTGRCCWVPPAVVETPKMERKIYPVAIPMVCPCGCKRHFIATNVRQKYLNPKHWYQHEKQKQKEKYHAAKNQN